MKVKELSKEIKLSMPTIIKYFEGEKIYKTARVKLSKYKKSDLKDYLEVKEKVMIDKIKKEHKDGLKSLSNDSHIAMSSWIRYIYNLTLSSNVKNRIKRYLKSHPDIKKQINKQTIEDDMDIDVRDMNEKVVKGENFKVYVWNFDKNIRKMQIEIKKKKPLIKDYKNLLETIKIDDKNIDVVGTIHSANSYGLIINLNNNKIENQLIETIDKIYK